MSSNRFFYRFVKRLIRVGSCGGVSDDIKVRDIIVGTGASTASATNRERFAGYDFAAIPDFELLKSSWQAAENLGLTVRFGNIFTNDLFYSSNPNQLPAMQKMGILAVEMETAALYAIAAEARVKALSILTVSDHLTSGEEDTTTEERQNSFNDMMKLALETAITTG